MASSIWKFPCPIEDRLVISMPIGATMLSVGAQHGCIQIWAHIPDVSAPKEDRVFAWYGTGNPCPVHPGKFIATVQLDVGTLIFHLFDRGNGRLPV